MGSLLRARQLIGVLLLLLGATAMTGWILRSQALVQILPGVVAMVFNTALCFAVTGLALLLERPRPGKWSSVQQGAGALVLGIAALVGLQNVLGVNLKIDELWFDVWLVDPNPHPGRMAPMTSFAFALAGLSMLLRHAMRSSERSRRLMHVFALAIIALGIIGITGYSLRLELLYNWYRFVRMAPHTAAGFILLGTGLWMSWYQALWAGQREQRTEQRITAVATVILLAMALSAGMAGFVLSSHRTEAALNNNLQAAHANRVQLLNFVIDDSIRQARSLATDPALVAKFTPVGAGALAGNDVALARHLLSTGYSSVAALSERGVSLLNAGTAQTGATIVLALGDGMRLLWDTHPVLEVRVTVQRDGRKLGVIVVQRKLEIVQMLLKDAKLLGKAGDIVVCSALPGNAMSCLPSRLYSKGFLQIGRMLDGKPLPMSHALDGKAGLAIARDYRGAHVAWWSRTIRSICTSQSAPSCKPCWPCSRCCSAQACCCCAGSSRRSLPRYCRPNAKPAPAKKKFRLCSTTSLTAC
jgi:hypothetical protein